MQRAHLRVFWREEWNVFAQCPVAIADQCGSILKVLNTKGVDLERHTLTSFLSPASCSVQVWGGWSVLLGGFEPRGRA